MVWFMLFILSASIQSHRYFMHFVILNHKHFATLKFCQLPWLLPSLHHQSPVSIPGLPAPQLMYSSGNCKSRTSTSQTSWDPPTGSTSCSSINGIRWQALQIWYLSSRLRIPVMDPMAQQQSASQPAADPANRQVGSSPSAAWKQLNRTHFIKKTMKATVMLLTLYLTTKAPTPPFLPRPRL